MPASPLPPCVGLAVALVGLEQPRAVARLGHIGPDRLLRRHDGRGVLHRRLGEEAGRLGELGVGVLAALAVGVGSADAGNAQDADSGRMAMFMVNLPEDWLPPGGRSWGKNDDPADRPR